MRYPEFLSPGGRIGFIAPSFGCVTEPYFTLFARARERFAAMGYECVLGPNCFADRGVGKSNTPEACGAEINDYFTKDLADVLISCGGGETMCEDLPFVDFEAIRNAAPRWFMGYSDNTNLVFTLPTLCDTAAIYAPCAGSFGMEPWHPALQDAFDVLTGRKLTLTNYDGWEKESLKDEADPTAPYHITEPYGLKIFAPQEKQTAEFSGRLIGGCLDCLAGLCGTRFDKTAAFAERYAEDGIVWFLESCDLTPLSIRRALWQLKNAGWFAHAKGFIIGRAFHYDEEQMGVDRINAVTESLSGLGVPILLDADLGHLPPMMPLIAGAIAEISAAPGRLSVKMSLK